MAKGSAMGLWRGKKGSSVFYKIANSNSAQKQGIRERNYEPQNPQTSSQAGQRMRMYPAQAVYGAIKEVIQRSWQGTKYGEDARREYLKRALSNPVFPAVEKNMGVVVPGPYQVAKGSLQEFPTVTGDAIIMTSLSYNNMVDYNAPIAEFSSNLLSLNSALKEGDQLTFIACVSNPGSFGFKWVISSVIIDSESDADLDPSFEPFHSAHLDLTYRDDSLAFVVNEAYDVVTYASCVIVSREGSTPLRSNATLACNFNVGDMPNYYSIEAINRAKISYMKKSTERTNSDWPADPVDDGGGDSGELYYNISVSTESEGGTVSTSPADGRIIRGSSITLNAVASSGYYFAGWYVGEEQISRQASYTFVPTSNMTIVGDFRLNG